MTTSTGSRLTSGYGTAYRATYTLFEARIYWLQAFAVSQMMPLLYDLWGFPIGLFCIDTLVLIESCSWDLTLRKSRSRVSRPAQRICYGGSGWGRGFPFGRKLWDRDWFLWNFLGKTWPCLICRWSYLKRIFVAWNAWSLYSIQKSPVWWCRDDIEMKYPLTGWLDIPLRASKNWIGLIVWAW